MPALHGNKSDKSEPLLEVRRSVDELRHSLSEVVSSISETQSLMKSQQRQIDDVIRSTGLHRVSNNNNKYMFSSMSFGKSVSLSLMAKNTLVCCVC